MISVSINGLTVENTGWVGFFKTMCKGYNLDIIKVLRAEYSNDIPRDILKTLPLAGHRNTVNTKYMKGSKKRFFEVFEGIKERITEYHKKYGVMQEEIDLFKRIEECVDYIR